MVPSARNHAQAEKLRSNGWCICCWLHFCWIIHRRTFASRIIRNRYVAPTLSINWMRAQLLESRLRCCQWNRSDEPARLHDWAKSRHGAKKSSKRSTNNSQPAGSRSDPLNDLLESEWAAILCKLPETSVLWRCGSQADREQQVIDLEGQRSS